jgi:hypothetical protein
MRIRLFSTPVLILGFRRPDNISKIIDAIRPNSPKVIFFSVDGPRKENRNDLELVMQTQLAIRGIDWDCDLKVRFREDNLGIRKAVPDAVSWALESNSEVIVIEDDAVPGPDLLMFMQNQLKLYRNDLNVAHVSGYNLAPLHEISVPRNLTRGSIYPESYLWGTWARAWNLYSDNIGDYGAVVRKMNINKIEKLTWFLNFRMAHRDLIQSWAYRWIASMWRGNKICISPNMNLTTHIGSKDGTHTRRKSQVNELWISSIEEFETNISSDVDYAADKWISHSIFHASPRGLIGNAIAYLALAAIKLQRKIR